MKTISHKQSRRKKARHARGRRWGTGPKPMFGSGRVRYEIGARINAMSYGGIGVVRRLVSKLGLAGEINRRLALLRRHLPYHESDHVLNIGSGSALSVRWCDPRWARSPRSQLCHVRTSSAPSP